MFEVQVNKITLSKPNRYVLLLRNGIETRRTEICQLWTSNPEFQNIVVSDVAGLEVKLCEASLDRKIRVVGAAQIKEEMLDSTREVLFEGELKLEQEVEGKMICVGLIHLRIARQREEIEQQPERQTSGQVPTEEEEDYELDQQRPEQEQEEDSSDEIRVEVHCGFNFYLGSEFYVEVEWGTQSLFKTRAVRDKINPVWAEGGRLRGLNSKAIVIRVRDSKKNILQSFKFLLSNLRTLFPYHLRLIFKEEYMGAVPEVYLSLIRESSARHSITELPLKFGLRNLGDSLKNAMYLMVSLSPTPKVPSFLPLDRSKYSTMQQTNDYLTKRTLGEEERVDLIGLCNGSTEKSLSLFKSYLNRRLYMFLIQINDSKSWFTNQNWESCRLIQSKSDLESILRRVYYQGEAFTFKKLLEFFNPNTPEPETEGKSSAQRWKLLTRNYILRNKLVNNSTRHIEDLKEAIEGKGKELVELKKILTEIKTVNFSLVGKEKLVNTIKNRAKSSKVYAKEIDTGGLISSLYEKQSILEGQKRINAELALRMQSLTEVQENQEDLDRDVLANAKKLHRQQESLTQMRSMQREIKKQRLLIGGLEKLFEKSEMDKRVNEALKQQREKLNKLKEKKQSDLKSVYKIIKENNSIGGNLAVKVKHAEEMLIKLNEQYARLTGL